MRVFLSLLLIFLIYSPVYSSDTLAFKEFKRIDKLYRAENYQKVLDIVLQIENRGDDNPLTYKYKGKYRSNALYWYYKTSCQINLYFNKQFKDLNSIISNIHHLRTIDRNKKYFNLPIYLQAKECINEMSLQNIDKNPKISNQYAHSILQIWGDTTPTYIKLNPKSLPNPSISDLKFDSAYTKIKKYDYSKIDQYTLSVTHKKNLKEQTLAIIKSAKNEHEKARAIYIWITYHISHDPPNIILKYKNGNSSLAELFTRMCAYAKLQSCIIVGIIDIKDFIGLHGWNAVMINNNVYMLDVTCGLFDIEKYFLATPNEDLNTHLIINEGSDLIDIEPELQSSLLNFSIFFIQWNTQMVLAKNYRLIK